MAEPECLQEAIHNFVHDMLHYSPAAQRIETLWRVSVSVPLVFDESIYNLGI